MLDVSTLNDTQLIRLINNRWQEGSELWKEIEKAYRENKKRWQNNPDWLKDIPKNRSKARDNRIWIDTETLIANLTGRPSKPNAIPGNETDEAQVIADNLQDFILEKYKWLKMKNKFRKGLRYLFFSRLIVFKFFWDPEKDDFDQKPVNPLKVRFTPVTANSIEEVECFIEEIEAPLIDIIDKFPDKEEKILSLTGFSSKEELHVNNPKEVYREAWIGDYVIHKFQGEILEKKKNPYWDWEGIMMEKGEMEDMRKTPGRKKRAMMTRVKGFQEFRKKPEAQEEYQYEKYFYNHFQKPLPPYVFGSVFEEKDKPIGETSIIEQAAPLQEEINKRKRQFSDNADMMNGVWKIDTNLCSLSKADAQRAKALPRGIIYGKGVMAGVQRETGKELPSFLKDDMIHSIAEVDNIFAAQPTFRGERGGQETARGRAMLREQSYQRLNELIDLIDYLHEFSYNWWLHFIKTRYTEEHLSKVIGREKAVETLGFMQDDIDEGIEVQVVPGQILPEDRFYRAERATEAAKAGLIDPLSFFEATEWDNPMKQAKRLVMFQTNPFSILDLDDEEKAKLQEAMQMFGQPGGEAEGGEGDQQKATQIAEVRQQAERILASEEFKRATPEQQRSIEQQIQQRLQAVTQAK